MGQKIWFLKILIPLSYQNKKDFSQNIAMMFFLLILSLFSVFCSLCFHTLYRDAQNLVEFNHIEETQIAFDHTTLIKEI